MVAEAFISRSKGYINNTELLGISQTIARLYPPISLSEKSNQAIATAALQDKKNEGGRILCTLLDGIGGFHINVPISYEEIMGGLAHYSTIHKS